MHELLFKNRISPDKKQRELFLSEHFEKPNYSQDIEKKTIYKVKQVLEFSDPKDAELFLNKESAHNPHVERFIVKSRSKKDATDKFIYKIIGNQYVLLKDKIIVLKIVQYVKKTFTYRKANIV